MPIRVRCQCSKTYSVKEEFAGKKIRCKECGSAIPVKAAQTNSGRSGKLAAPSQQDEFDDEFGGLEFGTAAVANATLPPRRTKQSAVEKPKTEKPKAEYGGDSLEDRISARTDAEVEENVRGAPWRELASAIFFFAVGAALYYYLDVREHEGGLVRLPRILAVVYLAIGKLGVLAICWGISLLSMIAAVLAFTGIIRIYHDDDD